ncbi:hypothetical protein D7241_08515 [Stutzerimonas sp. VN223-3]|uniref:hypothetical protein n=1 Tax=Stutzerimonas sp. VN223-3 TaxID=3384601 RepID=UPI0038B66788
MSVPVDPVSREDGFEHHDANVKVLMMVGFSIFVVLLLSGAGVAGLLWWYDKQPEPPTTALERQLQIPPEPRLENDPRAGGNRVLSQARMLISGYGWVDREAGLARIPVQRGMALLAERGWPSRAEPGETTPPRVQQAKGRAQP